MGARHVRERFASSGLIKSRCQACGKTEYLLRNSTCSMCHYHGQPWYHLILWVLVVAAVLYQILY